MTSAEGFRFRSTTSAAPPARRTTALTQHFAGQLDAGGLIREVTEKHVYSVADGRFLPDRYIEGTCPNCGFESARGDQCDNCTKQLDPTDLIDPRSDHLRAPPTSRCARPSISTCASPR
jgi:methionyl-tRNA synthetase